MTADQAIADLRAAVADTLGLLKAHGDDAVTPRLADYERRLATGDVDVVETLIVEATGGMGSLRDRQLSSANGDRIGADEEWAVNARLDNLVRQVEARARIVQSFCKGSSK
ncbi:MAG: hypothetical protein JWP35_2204 [Caulobacter sp.]|nr:hypothetical protein [Caulobacter sp.]